MGELDLLSYNHHKKYSPHLMRFPSIENLFTAEWHKNQQKYMSFLGILWVDESSIIRHPSLFSVWV
jgi:hypothetical protein